MEKYVVLNNQGDVIESGLTLEQAAHAVLEHDGHEWLIETDAEWVYAMRSHGSRNSMGGTVSMRQAAITLVDEPMDRLWQQVCDKAEEIMGGGVMTEAQFADMSNGEE